MPHAYHLSLTAEHLEGATCAFLPGDPDRVPLLAQAFDPQARMKARHREYHTWVGTLAGHPVAVTSTGIGGPSTAIAVEELAQLGVRTFLRVGTTGAIQEAIQVEDVVITTAAVRLDGTSTHYAPLGYPAVAHPEVLQACMDAARAVGVRHHVGITVSSDSFYPGQERYDTFSGYVIRSLRGSLEEWRRLGALNYEMEAATLLTVGSVLGLRCGCLCGVLVNRVRGERVDPAVVPRAEANAIRVAVAAMARLLAPGDARAPGAAPD